MPYDELQSAVDYGLEKTSEEAVRQRAERADVSLDKELRVVDFDGEIENALEELMFHDFYLAAIKTVIENVGQFFGYDQAIIHARKAPLRIDSEGNLRDFYGEGVTCLNVLIDRFETELGSHVTEKRIESAMERQFSQDKWGLLPENVRPGTEERDSEGLLGKILP